MIEEYTIKTYDTTKLFGYATRDEAAFIATQCVEPMRVVGIHLLAGHFNPAPTACAWIVVPRAMFASTDAALEKSMEPA